MDGRKKVEGGSEKGSRGGGATRILACHYSYSTTGFKDFRSSNRSITSSRIRFNTILIFKNSPSIHRSPHAAEKSSPLHRRTSTSTRKGSPKSSAGQGGGKTATEATLLDSKSHNERKEIFACLPCSPASHASRKYSTVQ
jgi:hypothetical protein